MISESGAFYSFRAMFSLNH